LVLGRKSGQTLQIGENIRLTILDVQGNRVKIGLQAPDSVTILRGEVKDFEGSVTGMSNQPTVRDGVALTK
jgi:carbon storage regulator CsrA